MRAVRYHEFVGPEKLQIEQVAKPELDGENVLIQIARASVSPLDDKVEDPAALGFSVYQIHSGGTRRHLPHPAGACRR